MTTIIYFRTFTKLVVLDADKALDHERAQLPLGRRRKEHAVERGLVHGDSEAKGADDGHQQQL